MDFRLKLFTTVAEEKSFSKAANKLHISQPAVSMQIKTLEEKYGVPLFERSHRAIKLTKAGEILYHHANKIIYNYAKINQLIEDMYHSAKGTLAIGSGYTFGEYILPHALATFKHKFPNITPKVTIKNSRRIFNQVVRNEIDIGIIESELTHADVYTKSFFKDEMVIIVPPDHPLSQQRTVEIEDLKQMVWILRESGSSTREFVSRKFDRLNIQPKSIIEFGSSQTIKGAVEFGLGISLISKKTITNELQLNRLVALNIHNESLIRNFYYVMNKSQLATKATNLFVDFIHALEEEFTFV